MKPSQKRRRNASKAFKDKAKRKRGRLWQAQRGRCYICGREIAPPGRAAADGATTDEIVPLSLGGKRRLGNVALAHLACNARKADRPPTACEKLYGRVIKLTLHKEPAPPRKRFVKPFEPFGQ